MSKIHQCNDGTEDITGRGTPNKIPCENQGGVVGSTPPPPPTMQEEMVYTRDSSGDRVSGCPEGYRIAPDDGCIPITQAPPPKRRMASGGNNAFSTMLKQIQPQTKQLLIFLAIGVVVVGAGMWYYKNRIEPKSFR